MSVNIYDVAKLSGVSLATVSRVINTPEKVKDTTREKVERVIEEIGFVPNAIAQGLAQKKSTTIAIVVPNILRASTAEIMDGISKASREYGYKILVYTLKNSTESTKDIFKSALASQVDGIIYINDRISDKEIEYLKNLKKPLVLANTILIGTKIPSSTIDYFQAAYDACKLLAKEGRKKIVFLRNEKDFILDRIKEQGYLFAIEELGLEPLICYGRSDIDLGREKYLKFIKNNNFDSVLGSRDSMTITFMNTLRDNTELKVPRDVSFIGFQNTRYAQLSRPSLSSINPFIYKIGINAMDLLTKLMKSEEIDNNAVITKHEFVFRNTTLDLTKK